MVLSVKPNLKTRTNKQTQRKRIIQGECIKAIRNSDSDKNKGDLYQTPGPGHIGENYGIFSSLLPRNYYMVEYFKDIYKQMLFEYKHIRKLITTNLHLEHNELFNIILANNEKNSVKYIDACFCCTPHKMIEDGFTHSLEKIFKSELTTNPWFFLLTYCLRYNNTIDHINSLIKIDNIFKNNKCKKIYNCSYADGTPMRTIVWKC